MSYDSGNAQLKLELYEITGLWDVKIGKMNQINCTPSFKYVNYQNRQSDFPTENSHGVGSPRIFTSPFPDINSKKRFPDPNGRGNRSNQIGNYQNANVVYYVHERT